MADHSSGDKSEKPSAQKLKKAREQGHVSRSKDLATAVGLLVCLRLTVWLMPQYLEDFRALFHLTFADLEGDGTLGNVTTLLAPAAMMLLFKMLLPLFVVPAAVLVASLIPGGWVFAGSNLMPKFERLSPMTNLGRLVSPKHLGQVAASVAKVIMVGTLLYFLASNGADEYARLQGLPLGPALMAATGMLLDGVMTLCGVFVLLAFIDVPIQRIFYLREQRMTKQEVKEEYKSSEGRPEVKQRMRQIQRALAQRAVRKTVPGADVVIVNPQHYAVALKYDEDRAEAPFVIAKGVDEMALYIREIAAEHQVEIVPAPPLARAIYNTSQVNQQIPATLYKSVALVLTYVLQIKAFRNGKRQLAPALPGDLNVPKSLSDPSTP